MSTVLQAAQTPVTLDDALLSMSTFYNGCDFKLRTETDGKIFLTYGCYGVHRNLVTGANRLLMLWLEESGGERELLDVSPETILQLRARKPCARCGGFSYKIETAP